MKPTVSATMDAASMIVMAEYEFLMNCRPTTQGGGRTADWCETMESKEARHG